MYMWKDLSISEKSQLISEFVKNGVTNLGDMRSIYNSYAEGGPMKNDAGFGTFMETLEKKGVDVSSGDYGYADAYNEDPLMAWNGTMPYGHMTDTYKTPSHATFSDESKYSNAKVNGGHWVEKGDGVWEFQHSDFTSGHIAETNEYIRNNEHPNTYASYLGNPVLNPAIVKAYGDGGDTNTSNLPYEIKKYMLQREVESAIKRKQFNDTRDRRAKQIGNFDRNLALLEGIVASADLAADNTGSWLNPASWLTSLASGVIDLEQIASDLYKNQGRYSPSVGQNLFEIGTQLGSGAGSTAKIISVGSNLNQTVNGVKLSDVPRNMSVPDRLPIEIQKDSVIPLTYGRGGHLYDGESEDSGQMSVGDFSGGTLDATVKTAKARTGRYTNQPGLFNSNVEYYLGEVLNGNMDVEGVPDKYRFTVKDRIFGDDTQYANADAIKAAKANEVNTLASQVRSGQITAAQVPQEYKNDVMTTIIPDVISGASNVGLTAAVNARDNYANAVRAGQMSLDQVPAEYQSGVSANLGEDVFRAEYNERSKPFLAGAVTAASLPFASKAIELGTEYLLKPAFNFAQPYLTKGMTTLGDALSLGKWGEGLDILAGTGSKFANAGRFLDTGIYGAFAGLAGKGMYDAIADSVRKVKSGNGLTLDDMGNVVAATGDAALNTAAPLLGTLASLPFLAKINKADNSVKAATNAEKHFGEILQGFDNSNNASRWDLQYLINNTANEKKSGNSIKRFVSNISDRIKSISQYYKRYFSAKKAYKNRTGKEDDIISDFSYDLNNLGFGTRYDEYGSSVSVEIPLSKNNVVVSKTQDKNTVVTYTSPITGKTTTSSTNVNSLGKVSGAIKDYRADFGVRFDPSLYFNKGIIGNPETRLYFESQKKSDKLGIQYSSQPQDVASAIKSDIDYINGKLPDGAGVGGSALLYVDGGIHGVPGDFDIVTTEDALDATMEALGATKSRNIPGGVKVNSKMLGGETDLEIIKKGKNGGSVGLNAHQLMETYFPDEYAKFMDNMSREAISNGTKSDYLSSIEIPMSPDELMAAYKKDPQKYQKHNMISSSKDKHANRLMESMLNGYPIYKDIIDKGKGTIAGYKSFFEAYPNVRLDNAEENKKFLQALGIDQDIENEEVVIRNLLEKIHFDMLHTRTTPLSSPNINTGDRLNDFMTGASTNTGKFRAAGAGGNTVMSGSAGGGTNYGDYTSAMQRLFNPDRINTPYDIIREINRIDRMSNYKFTEDELKIIQDVLSKYGINGKHIKTPGDLDDQLMLSYQTTSVNSDMTQELSEKLSMPGTIGSDYAEGRYFGTYTRNPDGISVRPSTDNPNSYFEKPFELGKLLLDENQMIKALDNTKNNNNVFNFFKQEVDDIPKEVLDDFYKQYRSQIDKLLSNIPDEVIEAFKAKAYEMYGKSDRKEIKENLAVTIALSAMVSSVGGSFVAIIADSMRDGERAEYRSEINELYKNVTGVGSAYQDLSELSKEDRDYLESETKKLQEKYGMSKTEIRKYNEAIAYYLKHKDDK